MKQDELAATVLTERSRVDDVPSTFPKNAVVFARTEDLVDCGHNCSQQSVYSFGTHATLEIPLSLMEAVERGLVRTQSGLATPPLPTRNACEACGPLSFALEFGVPGGVPTDTVEVTDLWRSW